VRAARRGFRLPADVRPTDYHIALRVDPIGERFAGEATIRLELGRARTAIELHAAALRVARVTWTAGTASDARPARALLKRHPDRETVEVRLPARARAGSGTLRLRFSGALQRGLRGLYGASADGRSYAFTQLEAADARRFFPCFDEPTFKARFTFRVTADGANAIVSNMPIAREREETDGSRTVEFEPTPPLSTYLCALAVGPLECSSPRHVGPTPVRVWHVPGKGHLTATALEAAAEALARLERYFDLPYPYPKLDLVAVPDFEAGAMENAGAVFFRETLLLADPATLSLGEHKRIAEVVAHELAHMWYGNLVTMAWWNDLWLNEAFATWMAFRIVDDWRPEWRMWNTFEHHRAAALQLDALRHTHAIYSEVRDAAEATQNFDAITYEKGAAVLRMVENYLGAEAFRDGVRLYIRRHREGNTRARDLWRALAEASGSRVDHVVRRWTETPGFPLLRVRAEERDGGVVFAVRQERFLADPRATAAARRRRWPVPWVVRYRTRTAPGTSVIRTLVEGARETVPLDAEGPLAWYYGNAEEGGFFRVSHDTENLARLAAALPGALSPVERMGLVGTQWALVRSGAASIETFLDLLDRFDAERDHYVLERLVAALGTIDELLVDAAGSASRPAFRAWLDRLFTPQLVQLGWDPKVGESQDTRLRRAVIVEILGLLAEVPAVCSTAAARAARYLRDRASLEANLVEAVTRIDARQGDPARFEAYRGAAREARTPQERRRFQLALADFRDPALIDRALALSLTDEIATQDVALFLVRALGNRSARERVWRLIVQRWSRLTRRLPPMMVSRLIDALPSLQTPAFKREVAAFFRAHPVPTAARALRQALERFDLNAEMQRRAAPGLGAWLAATIAPRGVTKP
jgi:puromycin-sensitive aminopeptidase